MNPLLQPVDLADPAARTAFAAFGSTINARNPRHLPRPVSRELALLDPATNVWLADTALAAWIVRDGGAGPVIGRIAAMHPTDAQRDACLGLYEAEDDARVARLLIDAGVQWLASRGVPKALAPVDFSIFQNYRCQTGGFDEPPFVGEPRNPPYYGAQFQALGFVPANRWESHDMDREQTAAAADACASDFADAEAAGYRFEDFRSCSNEEAMRRTWALINASYGQMPGFVTLPWERFRDHYAHLPLLVDKYASTFAYDPDGARVGFSIALKDLSAALRAMRGHTGGLGVWLDRLRFLLHARGGPLATAYQIGVPFREIKRAAVLGRRRLGRPFALGKAIYHHSARRILDQKRYRRVVIALLREDTPNIVVTRSWSRLNREYTLYERLLS